jgi:hypothetical protein
MRYVWAVLVRIATLVAGLALVAACGARTALDPEGDSSASTSRPSLASTWSTSLTSSASSTASSNATSVAVVPCPSDYRTCNLLDCAGRIYFLVCLLPYEACPNLPPCPADAGDVDAFVYGGDYVPLPGEWP